MVTALARSDDTVGTPTSINTQDFWLFFTPVGNGRGFIDALYSLYYLPENYKLAVDKDVSVEMQASHGDLMSRIQQKKTKAGLSKQTTPSVFIYNDIVSARQAKSEPAVVISQTPEQDIKDHEWGGFVVPAGQPEALASAVLNIARAF